MAKIIGATQARVFCMEATGVYGVALAGYLHQASENVIVANPIKTHAFVKMEMIRNKTDKADALSIARYCQHIVAKGELGENRFKPKGKAFATLQCLVTRLEQLGKQLTQENNRLHVSLNKATCKSMIISIKKQMQLIENEIKTLVNGNPELGKHSVVIDPH